MSGGRTCWSGRASTSEPHPTSVWLAVQVQVRCWIRDGGKLLLCFPVSRGQQNSHWLLEVSCSSLYLNTWIDILDPKISDIYNYRHYVITPIMTGLQVEYDLRFVLYSSIGDTTAHIYKYIMLIFHVFSYCFHLLPKVNAVLCFVKTVHRDNKCIVLSSW